jgi:hypothetical protein
LDLKDAFFCVQLAHVSQPIFAFQWEDSHPSEGGQQQLTWTRLLQGFKNSPTIFGTALASDLQAYSAEEAGCTLLQYVDDLLLAVANHQDCLKGTEFLLRLLWEAGYKVSRKKALICQDQVKYLGFHISQGQQNLGAERKQAVCSIQTPTSRRQIHEFLGAAGFCQIWIPNFYLLAKPLYEATKGGKMEPLIWESDQQQAFHAIKKALVNAPALGLPDMRKPFFLYVHERSSIATRVLTQFLD